MPDDYRLQEILDSASKYYWNEDAFSDFRDREFFRYGPDMRVAVLQGWDKLMQEETKPTRETASLISKKRELDAMHQLLSKAGR
ncbi:MAG: hypothetical protein WAK55_22025 [Xanthobacteraceae bacterium]